MKEYRDHYFKLAKQQNYPARSVYKLKEMESRFHLFRAGMKVLDLGASPGSWTKYALERIGAHGLVVAVDLNPLDLGDHPGLVFFQDDVFRPSAPLRQTLTDHGPFDCVLSDMAPKTSGVKFSDQARSFDLAIEALALAREWLVQGGHFVVKIFEGPDVKELSAAMREVFLQVKTFKPKSSRTESKEIFYLGLDRKDGK